MERGGGYAFEAMTFSVSSMSARVVNRPQKQVGYGTSEAGLQKPTILMRSMAAERITYLKRSNPVDMG